MYDIFISFSSKEESSAEFVRSVLETNKITCWKAPQNIPLGSDYAKAIPDAISECQIFLLMLSEKSQKSPWVRKELDMAVNCGKLIIPFVMEDCQLNEAFNFILSNVQRYNAYQKNAEAMGDLVKQIYAITGKPLVVPMILDDPPLDNTSDEDLTETNLDNTSDEDLTETNLDNDPDQEPVVVNDSAAPIRCPRCGSDKVVRIGAARRLAAGMAAGMGTHLFLGPMIGAVAAIAAAGAVQTRYRCKSCKIEFKSVVQDKPDQTAETIEEESGKE